MRLAGEGITARGFLGIGLSMSQGEVATMMV